MSGVLKATIEKKTTYVTTHFKKLTTRSTYSMVLKWFVYNKEHITDKLSKDT